MKMIVVFDSTPKVEQPLKAIEEIPEGTDPDDVFNKCLEGYDGQARMGYMFIHPAFGAYVQASAVHAIARSDAEAYALNRYMLGLCRMIEVDRDFRITQEECLAFYKGLMNRWVAIAST